MKAASYNDDLNMLPSPFGRGVGGEGDLLPNLPNLFSHECFALQIARCDMRLQGTHVKTEGVHAIEKCLDRPVAWQLEKLIP